MAKTKPQAAKRAKPESVKKDFRRWYPYVLIVIIFLLYGKTTGFHYVKMDDMDLIVQNESFLKHTSSISKAFQQSTFKIPGQLTDNKSYYRPLLIVSFILDYQWHGAKPSAFHFMNILYHILMCLLLYGFLKKIGAGALTSFALTLLFAVHPINSQAVAWIPGRNDILLGIFALISFHALFDYHKNKDYRSLTIHLFAFAAALFTKESGVLLFPFYLLFLWLWLRDASFIKRNLWLPACYLLITIGWYFAMKSVLKGQALISGQVSPIQTFIHNLPYLFLYLGKILLPFNLNVQPGVDTLAIILGSVSFIAILAILYKVKDRRIALFSLAWYFAFILPTLIVPELPAYEHRDYLPLAGLLFGLSQSGIFQGFSWKSKSLIYTFSGFSIVFIIILLFRLPIFSDPISFWTDGTESVPVFAATSCVNLGEHFRDEFDNNPMLNEYGKKEALKKDGEWTAKALGIDSSTIRANNNYGAFLYLSGHPDNAVPYFQKEIKLFPAHSDAYKNMGIYYKEKGQPEKSLVYWEKLIKLNRFYLTAYEELANYYQKTGDIAKAAMYRDELKTVTEEAGK